jgi:hypothetical protein
MCLMQSGCTPIQSYYAPFSLVSYSVSSCPSIQSHRVPFSVIVSHSVLLCPSIQSHCALFSVIVSHSVSLCPIQSHCVPFSVIVPLHSISLCPIQSWSAVCLNRPHGSLPVTGSLDPNSSLFQTVPNSRVTPTCSYSGVAVRFMLRSPLA